MYEEVVNLETCLLSVPHCSNLINQLEIFKVMGVMFRLRTAGHLQQEAFNSTNLYKVNS